ncbi:hypothetical protein C8R43DRAFT_1139326 [Mycena crocata]|nr:hypothetical protein C8R43DRAFT_1139326 [Mycena crocata]
MSSNHKVNETVLTFVRDPKYRPPQLPLILDSDWAGILTIASAVGDSEILLRDLLLKQGKDVLNYAFLLLLADEMAGKPIGFYETIKAAIGSKQTLEEIMRRIDGRLLDNDVKKVDGGFYTVVGHIWTVVEHSMDQLIIQWLKPVFGAIIEVATTAFMEEFKVKTTRDRRPAKDARDPSDFIFLRNLHSIQTTPDIDPDRSDESMQSASSSGIPKFDSAAWSPLDPAVLSRPIEPKASPASLQAVKNSQEEFLSVALDWSNLPGPSAIDTELLEREEEPNLPATSANSLLPAHEIETRIHYPPSEETLDMLLKDLLEQCDTPASVKPQTADAVSGNRNNPELWRLATSHPLLVSQMLKSPAHSKTHPVAHESPRPPLTPLNT